MRSDVMAPYDRLQLGGGCHRHAAIVAGFRDADYHEHRVRVELVRKGFERPMAFGCIPLVVRAAVQ